MYTAPSPDDVLEGVIISLQNDVLPNLTNAKAQVSLVMAQALLQMLRQQWPLILRELVRRRLRQPRRSFSLKRVAKACCKKLRAWMLKAA